MRSVCVAALVLLTLEASCHSIFKSYNSDITCCEPKAEQLKWNKILSYTETDNICKDKAYIVRIKDGPQKVKTICADAKKDSVRKAINYYNKHMRLKKQ